MKTLATPFRGKFSHLTEDGQTTMCRRPILSHWDTYLTNDRCPKCGTTKEFADAARQASLPELFIPVEVPAGSTIEQTASHLIARHPEWHDELVITVFDAERTETRRVIDWIESFIVPEEG